MLFPILDITDDEYTVLHAAVQHVRNELHERLLARELNAEDIVWQVANAAMFDVTAWLQRGITDGQVEIPRDVWLFACLYPDDLLAEMDWNGVLIPLQARLGAAFEKGRCSVVIANVNDRHAEGLKA